MKKILTAFSLILLLLACSTLPYIPPSEGDIADVRFEASTYNNSPVNFRVAEKHQEYLQLKHLKKSNNWKHLTTISAANSISMYAYSSDGLESCYARVLSFQFEKNNTYVVRYNFNGKKCWISIYKDIEGNLVPEEVNKVRIKRKN